MDASGTLTCPGPAGRVLHRAAEATAVAGGLVLVGLSLVTVYDILGRLTADLAQAGGWTGWLAAQPPLAWVRPLAGSYELMELGAAVAVFACLPYAQLRGAHVAAEVFTQRLGLRARAALTAAGDAAFCALAAVLAWRLAAGAIDLERYGQTSMILQVPTWWAAAAGVPCLALLALACAYTGWRRLAMARGGRAGKPA